MSHNIDLQQLSQANRGRSATVHTLQPVQKKVYPFQKSKGADGQVLNTPLSQTNINHGMISHFKFAPSTAMPSLASQSQVDIRVPAGSVGTVRDIYIEIDLKNNSLNPAILAGEYVHNLIDRIDLLAESGSVIVQRWTNTALQSAVLYDSYSENNHRLQMSALDPLGVAAGASVKTYIRLPWSVFSTGHVSVQGLKSDLFLRIVFRPDSDCFTSYPDVLSLSNVQVHVESINWTSPVARALSNRMRSTVQQYKFWSWNEMKEIVNLSPSSSYDVRLSSVLGLVSGFFVWVRPNGHTLLNTVDSSQLETFSLNDASGRSLIGSSTFDRDVTRIHKDQNDMLFDLVSATNKKLVDNVLYVPISFNDKRNLESASLIGGYYPADGHLRFQFTTNSSLVAGNYEITFVYSRLDYITSDAGSVSVHSS
jgi:hypothetical protein